ncbi:MAG: FHA domain-containing protein [Acidimicrobiia bacterium]|nr:FHA domain-containing protein [Acidimicrobiia bacterium]
MSEQLLALLKLCLLALLYLFFLRVLWAVWTQVRTPRKKPSGRPRRPAVTGARGGGPASRLVVVEPTELAGREFPLGDELTVGRAAGCQVTLDDTYVSQLHSRIFLREGSYLVEDLGSTNGTYLNRRRVSGPMVMQQGDKLQVGSTVMELT